MSRLEDMLAVHGDIKLSHMYDPAEYDPQQAHEYYERHKKLKGRVAGSAKPVSRRRNSRAPHVIKKVATAKVKPKKSPEQRRKEVEARVASLKAKLARLSQILEKLVREAKARSGVDVSQEDPKKTASTSSDKKSSDSKLTPQEKKEAAKRSQEYRDKHKDTPEEQAAALQEKIDQISEKIRNLRAEAAAAKAEDAKRTSSSVGARAKPNK